jgi:ferric-dicitrate binding protein FerR (iron transport regulator)
MDEKINQLLAKKLSGEATSEELELLNQLITESGEDPHTWTELEDAWKRSNFRTVIKNSDQVFESIIQRAEKEDFQSKPKTHLTTSLFFYHKFAASLTLLLIAGLTAFLSVEYVQNLGKGILDEKVAILNKTVNKGQKLKIFLPDGSQVYLNSESSISYPEQFSSTCREVSIKGEAFFEVKRNPEVPFIVHSGAVNISVLGTSFNIRNYQEENKVQVALVSGSLSVATDSNATSHLLQPGEQAIYQNLEEEFSKETFDLRTITAWKDGILLFENDSYQNIVHKLERWYDVEITTNKPDQPEWQFSGEFNNEYLEVVLESISYTKNFKYTINQKNIYLEF